MLNEAEIREALTKQTMRDIAIQKGTQVRVGARFESVVHDAKARSNYYATVAHNLRVTVSDNSSGIKNDEIEKVETILNLLESMSVEAYEDFLRYRAQTAVYAEETVLKGVLEYENR